MLGFGAGAVEYEAVPVEVAQIHIGISACLIRNNPGTGRVFLHVVAAVVEHLHLFIGISPCPVSFESLVEIGGQGHIVVAAGHEIRRGGVLEYRISQILGIG